MTNRDVKNRVITWINSQIEISYTITIRSIIEMLRIITCLSILNVIPYVNITNFSIKDIRQDMHIMPSRISTLKFVQTGNHHNCIITRARILMSRLNLGRSSVITEIPICVITKETCTIRIYSIICDITFIDKSILPLATSALN